MSEIKVTQVKSEIGGSERQRQNLRSLGLRGIGDSVVKPDSPEFRGMINKVSHLVKIEEVK
jgi:large subunit ribosomal protein L30